MTAKVASPACPGLGIQRSVSSQALAASTRTDCPSLKAPTPPTRALLSLSDDRFSSPSPTGACGSALSLSTHPTLPTNPGRMQSRHITAAAAAPGRLSYYLGRASSLNSGTFPSSS